MILESSITLLSWPGAHFKGVPWYKFITRCWDLNLYIYIFEFWCPSLSFEVTNLTFEDCFETKLTFLNILTPSAIILAWFPYMEHLFLMKFVENKPKSIKINPVVVVSPGNCNKYPSNEFTTNFVRQESLCRNANSDARTLSSEKSASAGGPSATALHLRSIVK